MSTTVPLFPLGSPLLPGMVLPLHIFEPRYRRLVTDLLQAAQPDAPSMFGVVAIDAGLEVGEDAATSLAEVGCLAEVRAVAELPDGRFELVAVGVRRFRSTSVIRDRTPYLQARVEWLGESEDDASHGLSQRAADAFAAYRTALGGDPCDLPDNPTLLSYALGSAIVLPPADRQQVLASPATSSRLRLLLRLLQREQAMLGRLQAVPATDLLRAGISPN